MLLLFWSGIADSTPTIPIVSMVLGDGALMQIGTGSVFIYLSVTGQSLIIFPSASYYFVMSQHPIQYQEMERGNRIQVAQREQGSRTVYRRIPRGRIIP